MKDEKAKALPREDRRMTPQQRTTAGKPFYSRAEFLYFRSGRAYSPLAVFFGRKERDMSFRQTLISSCAPFGIVLTDGQLDLCEKYFDMLVETNRSMNLTAITDPDQAAVLHFSDSLALLKFIDIPRSARLIDVGTGAGFPGLPLKIARNDIDLTLLDALNKRLGFLQSVLYNTGLTAGLLHSRAEDAGRDPAFRESFDVAVCRAVAKLNVLAEYCLPLLKCAGVLDRKSVV